MPLTVAAVESELVTLLGPILTRVGLDGATVDGSNPSLRGSIRRAVRRLGLATTDPIAVTDDDLSGVDGDAVETLIDLAELRTLETIWGNWPEVDQQAGEERQFLNQLAERVQARVEQLKERLGTLALPAEEAETVEDAKPKGMAYAVIRAGLEYPPVSTPRTTRRSFWHDGRYYP